MRKYNPSPLLVAVITSFFHLSATQASAEYCLVNVAQPGVCVDVRVSCTADFQANSMEYGNSVAELCQAISTISVSETQCQEVLIESQDEAIEQSIGHAVERDMLFKKVARLTIQNRRLRRALKRASIE